jgi:putative spermidine/putrescine transport system permease protein
MRLISLLFSLFIALISSFLSIFLGTIIATGIWRLPDKLRIMAIVYKIPLILPHITIAFITVLFLSKPGVLSRISYHLGLIENFITFPNILYSGKGIGIIIAYTIKETTFVILMVLGVLLKLPETQIQTAKMLGANHLQTFLTVVIPFIKPAVKMSFIIIFLYSLGAFDIPYIMSESQPEMISVSIYNTFFKRDLIHRPEAAAELIILFTISLTLLISFFKHKRNKYES